MRILQLKFQFVDGAPTFLDALLSTAKYGECQSAEGDDHFRINYFQFLK